MKKYWLIPALIAGVGIIGGIVFCQFAYGRESISAKELKLQFEQDNDSLLPVYNLEQDAVLCFDFALDYQYIENYETDGLEMISVHTDADCGEDSIVDCYMSEEEIAGATRVYVSPIVPVFATKSLEDQGEDQGNWGCAPMYYICIRQTIDSKEPDKAESAVVIPFTVASESEVPMIEGRIDASGVFSLSWDVVEGAQYYTIYERMESSHFVTPVGTTKDTCFSMGELSESTGMNGNYYVTATVNGCESNLSAVVDTSDLKFLSDEEKQKGLTVLEGNEQLNKLPSMAVKCVLAQSETDGNVSGEEVASLYETLCLRTEEVVAQGEGEEVKKPVEGCRVFADSAEEAWIAYGLMNGEETISLKAFPALQNPYVLEDTFLKVCHQNPYILGVHTYTYDYEQMALRVTYIYDKGELKKRQKAIVKEAEKVIASIIKEDMTQAERVQAIYLWLEEHCVYADESWEQLKGQQFSGRDADRVLEDSANAYGALVNGEALCGGYASACQLLSYMAGVKTVTVNGYLNGNIPHAWNMIYEEGNWYQLDCSSNYRTTGVPYYLYYADMQFAKRKGYVLDKDFVLDYEWDVLTAHNHDNQKEYYASAHLRVGSMAEVEWTIHKYMDEEMTAFCCDGFMLEEDELIEVVRRVYLTNGREENLDKLQYQQAGEYIVLFVEK